METLNENLTKYKECFQIGSFDTDLNGKAKLTSICNYLQEIAGNHIDVIHQGVDDLRAENMTWVLSRLRLKMLHFPVWKDKIEIETWSIGTDGLFGNREFEISNSKGETIAIASSSWLIINILNKRPVRPQKIVEKMPLNMVSPLFENSLGKLQINEELFPKEDIPIHYSDIDINQHVNNVKYIKWIIDSCPLELLTHKEIEQLEINFLHETKLEDELKIFQSNPTDQSEIVLKNNNTNREHCRAIINWK